MESSRTSLAERSSSRTHFEVLVLGLKGQVLSLEASSPRKLPCPRLGDSTFLEPLKFSWKTSKILRKSCEDPFLFSAVGDRLKNLVFLKTFFLRTLAPVSFVLGLEHSCPWPREGMSRKGLSLTWASSLASSTPPLVNRILTSVFELSCYYTREDLRLFFWLLNVKQGSCEYQYWN